MIVWRVSNHAVLDGAGGLYASVLVPDTRNILINPDHPDTGSIEIVDRIAHPLDPRLMT